MLFRLLSVCRKKTEASACLFPVSRDRLYVRRGHLQAVRVGIDLELILAKLETVYQSPRSERHSQERQNSTVLR